MEHALHDVNVAGLELRHHLSFGVLVVEEGYEDQPGWVHLLTVFGVQLLESVNINVTDVRLAEGYTVQIRIIIYFHPELFSPFFTCKRFRPDLNSPRHRFV